MQKFNKIEIFNISLELTFSLIPLPQVNNHPPEIRELFDQKSSGPELWTKFKEGDYAAYEAIYKIYVNFLFEYGMKISADEEIVEDCIHDIFVDLWGRRKSLTITSSLKFYLLKALRRRIIYSLKSSEKRKFSQLGDFNIKFASELSHEEKMVNDQLDNDRSVAVKNALEHLTKRQKEAVYMKYYCDLEYSEIAAIMSISAEAVYNLISKSITRLKTKLPYSSIISLLIFFS